MINDQANFSMEPIVGDMINTKFPNCKQQINLVDDRKNYNVLLFLKLLKL